MEFNDVIQEPLVKVGAWAKVYPSELIMLKAEINYTKIFTSDGNQFLVALTLKELERRLDTFTFIRPHKSFLVNTKYVTDFTEEADETFIHLLNDWKINVSRRKKADILKAVENKIVNFLEF